MTFARVPSVERITLYNLFTFSAKLCLSALCYNFSNSVKPLISMFVVLVDMKLL